MAKQLLHFVHSGSVNFFLVTMYFDGYIHQGVSAPNCKMCSNSQKKWQEFDKCPSSLLSGSSGQGNEICEYIQIIEMLRFRKF